MFVRFKSHVIVDPVTIAQAGDELDIAIPVARALIAQRIAEPAEPASEEIFGTRELR